MNIPLMKENGIRAADKRKYKATTNSKHTLPLQPNPLEQCFFTQRLDQSRVSDITYICTAEGWLYLATVMDLHSCRVMGWSMAEHMRTDLVIDALGQALSKRCPQAGLIHHPDRGSQYCSHAYIEMLKRYGIRSSMSGKGNCYDNAAMESFYGSLKSELVYREKSKTRQETKSAIFEYIEVFYNCQRLHSYLGYMTPHQYEKRYTEQMKQEEQLQK